jgi:2-dehydropantoate 2-reductase
MYRLILEELAAVAKAEGIELPPQTLDGIMAAADNLGAAFTSSLHYDLTHGRRLEIEALHGHAVRLGEKHGVPTPTLFSVYAALRPHRDGAPV